MFRSLLLLVIWLPNFTQAFPCISADSVYPNIDDLSCVTYYSCHDFTAHLHQCPDGFQFHYINLQCQPSDEVACDLQRQELIRSGTPYGGSGVSGMQYDGSDIYRSGGLQYNEDRGIPYGSGTTGGTQQGGGAATKTGGSGTQYGGSGTIYNTRMQYGNGMHYGSNEYVDSDTLYPPPPPPFGPYLPPPPLAPQVVPGPFQQPLPAPFDPRLVPPILPPPAIPFGAPPVLPAIDPFAARDLPISVLTRELISLLAPYIESTNLLQSDLYGYYDPGLYTGQSYGSGLNTRSGNNNQGGYYQSDPYYNPQNPYPLFPSIDNIPRSGYIPNIDIPFPVISALDIIPRAGYMPLGSYGYTDALPYPLFTMLDNVGASGYIPIFNDGTGNLNPAYLSGAIPVFSGSTLGTLGNTSPTNSVGFELSGFGNQGTGVPFGFGNGFGSQFGNFNLGRSTPVYNPTSQFNGDFAGYFGGQPAFGSFSMDATGGQNRIGSFPGLGTILNSSIPLFGNGFAGFGASGGTGNPFTSSGFQTRIGSNFPNTAGYFPTGITGNIPPFQTSVGYGGTVPTTLNGQFPSMTGVAAGTVPFPIGFPNAQFGTGYTPTNFNTGQYPNNIPFTGTQISGFGTGYTGTTGIQAGQPFPNYSGFTGGMVTTNNIPTPLGFNQAGSFPYGMSYVPKTGAGIATGYSPVGFGAAGGQNTGYVPSPVGFGSAGGQTTGYVPSPVGFGAAVGQNTGYIPLSVGFGAAGGQTTGYIPSPVGFGAAGGQNTGYIPSSVGFGAAGGQTTGYIPSPVGFGAAGGQNTEYIPSSVGFGDAGGQTTGYVPSPVGFGAAGGQNTGYIPSTGNTGLYGGSIPSQVGTSGTYVPTNTGGTAAIPLGTNTNQGGTYIPTGFTNTGNSQIPVSTGGLQTGNIPTGYVPTSGYPGSGYNPSGYIPNTNTNTGGVVPVGFGSNAGYIPTYTGSSTTNQNKGGSYPANTNVGGTATLGGFPGTSNSYSQNTGYTGLGTGGVYSQSNVGYPGTGVAYPSYTGSVANSGGFQGFDFNASPSYSQLSVAGDTAAATKLNDTVSVNSTNVGQASTVLNTNNGTVSGVSVPAQS